MVNPLTAALFQPFQSRSLTLANRTVMAPMGRMFAENGVPSTDAPAYYQRRAQGGVGLVICEATGVDHPLSVDHPAVPVMHGEAALEGWKRVVDAVHSSGGKIIPQLFHQGPLRGGSIADGGIASLRPSGTIGPDGPNSYDPGFFLKAVKPTSPMTDSDIQDAIDAFARSAANAKSLGFDGVAIHGAHGYLIDSFLWGETNRRTDRYGGDQKQRATFAGEVIRSVRKAIGEQLPIFFRLSLHKSHNYAARTVETPAELEALLGPIVDAGVDVLDTSIRRFYQPAFEGSALNLAGWTKKLSGKPTMAVGSVGLSNTASETFLKEESLSVNNIPQLMDRFNDGEFDLIAIGRSLIGDPDFVAKLRNGEEPIPFSRSALDSLI
ncbi:NADH:flavin oxidoreductase [Pseudomonas sp. BF-R-19]|uniref:NADH:flavin oxidoreductase n=1 Tax=Pseudomonas sp. BF-R-19 TaxID=2832397 RepID=UPI001CBD35FD|nr:NADH:flavin oxidoreductase [Pseudomonas sp. BF-R-19]